MPFAATVFIAAVDGTATLITEHDNQTGAQNIDCLLDASQAFVVEHIARDSHDKEISEAFIKDKFVAHANRNN